MSIPGMRIGTMLHLVPLNMAASRTLHLCYLVSPVLCKSIQAVVVGLHIPVGLFRTGSTLSDLSNLSAGNKVSGCCFGSESRFVDSWEMSLSVFLVFDSVPMLYLSKEPMSVG